MLPTKDMKTRLKSIYLLLLLACLLFAACDTHRGESRNIQLEQTAEDLEAKAVQIRTDVEETAEKKTEEAKVVRETKGDEETAKLLEKDASVTKEIGKMRAEQLEEQAEKVRDQKEETKSPPVQNPPK
jgi:predicted small secreted protein